MTAVDVSAIGRSNVERPTPDVQSKRDRRGLTQRFSYDFAPAPSAWLRTGFTKSPRRLLPSRTERSNDRGQRSVTRSSLGKSALIAGGTQSFHLSVQQNHSLSNAFVFLRDSCDRPCDCALVDKALKLFVSTQAQQLFTAIGCVSLPQIEQNNVE